MKYKIDIAPLCDYYVVAVKDKHTDELKETFTLNETGADMLKIFCQKEDWNTVAEDMAEIYEMSKESMSEDIEAFANKLKQKGII